MSRRNAVFQFGMQNEKVQCSFQIGNAKCQGAMHFSNSECKRSRRNAVLQFGMQRRNAVFQFGMQNVCQGAMLIINFDIHYNTLEFKMKILCRLSHGLYF